MDPLVLNGVPQSARGWAAGVGMDKVQDVDFKIWFLGVSR